MKINSLFIGYEITREIIHDPNARNHPSSADHEEENDDDFLLGTQNWKKGNVEKGKASSSKGDETVANLNIVIATFIAGITFASAVQVPGGYDDKGVANLKSKASFKYFLVYNFMAFGFAAGSLLIHFACEILPRVFGAWGGNLVALDQWGFHLSCGLLCLQFLLPLVLSCMQRRQSYTTT